MKVVLVIILLQLLHSTLAWPVDRVIVNRPQSDKDLRMDYTYQLLDMVLRASKDKYGDYVLEQSSSLMERNRQMKELQSAEQINVLVSPPKPGWEGHSIRVKFPVDKGLASFRLALLNEKNKDLTKNITTIDELKRLSTGAHNQWSTTIILRKNKFNLVTGAHYLPLFKMLATNRFQTFPRGLNEIYLELDLLGRAYPNLIVDKHVAVFMYLPTYFYVSKKDPKIAERIEYGLLKMFNNGDFDHFFNSYFGKDIDRANLEKRKIFYLENTNLPSGLFENDRKYLLNFAQEIIEKNTSSAPAGER